MKNNERDIFWDSHRVFSNLKKLIVRVFFDPLQYIIFKTTFLSQINQ